MLTVLRHYSILAIEERNAKAAEKDKEIKSEVEDKDEN